MKIEFRNIHLSSSNLIRLETINKIISKYQDDGYVLTLRQLYYQLVSADIIPNKVSEYAKLSNLLKEGRIAGIVDWDAIEDRLRKPDNPASWNNPAEIINACIKQYRKDRMKGQNTYLEVWVEKDALSGVLKRVTYQYGIPIIVNRGYSSVTAMYDAYNRFEDAYNYNDQNTTVIYIGDFDPSGQDMIRDILDRINEFNGSFTFNVEPIALTWDQIKEFNPPPNPAKITDPRAKEYIKKHGPTSWEVDALKPEVLNKILTNKINEYIDSNMFDNVLLSEQRDKKKLKELSSKL